MVQSVLDLRTEPSLADKSVVDKAPHEVSCRLRYHSVSWRRYASYLHCSHSLAAAAAALPAYHPCYLVSHPQMPVSDARLILRSHRLLSECPELVLRLVVG